MATSPHKAPTAVSLAPLAEKSPFERAVQRYWIPGTLVVVGIATAILVRAQMSERKAASRDDSWDRLSAGAPSEGFPRVPTARPETLEQLATELGTTEAAPWAWLAAARSKLEEGQYEGAAASLERLDAAFASHSVVSDTWPLGAAGESMSLSEYLAKAGVEEFAWRSAHGDLYANPPLPEGAPRVRFRTAAGTFVVGLYSDRAPQLTSTFLSNCTDGSYSGSSIYRVAPAVRVDAGDLTTKGPDRATWGQEPVDADTPADTSGLRHFEGVLSAEPGSMPGTCSSTRFSLLASPEHSLNSTRVVFGAVVEGIEVVRAIAARDANPSRPGELAEPVLIEACEVL